jgi:ABC-2 type transport system permease protein
MSATSASGAIYDRGYRHYSGPREGRGRAIRALYWAGIRRALGIKRPWRTKLVPFALLLLAFAPAVAFVGVRVLLGQAGEEFASFGQLVRNSWIFLILFAGTAGPEVICPDRRSRVLTLVFTRPVTRLDYIAGKLGALLTLMALISIGPPLLVFIGSALTEPNALAFVRDSAGDLARIVLGGALIAVFYAVVSLAMASLTELRSIATASFLGLFLATTAIANTLFFAGDIPGRRFLAFLSLGEYQTRFADWLFSYSTFDGDMAKQAGWDGSVYLVAIVVVTLLAGALLAWRTRKLAA